MAIVYGHGRFSAEAMVIRDPDEVRKVLTRVPQTDGFARYQDELADAVRRFDAVRFEVRCQAEGCKRRAKWASVYKQTPRCRWWCKRCDPCEGGVAPDKLAAIRTYADAMYYVAAHCNGRAADLKALVRELARAKGLPDRATEAAIIALFRGAAGSEN